MKNYALIPKTKTSFQILEGTTIKATISVHGEIINTNTDGTTGIVLVKNGTQRKQYTYNLITRTQTGMVSI